MTPRKATDALVQMLRLDAADAEGVFSIVEQLTDHEPDDMGALDRTIAAEAKLSKILDLTRAWTKGESADDVLRNVQRVLGGQPLIDEPTWAYNH